MRHARFLALLMLATGLFLFAPAMQGIGLTVGQQVHSVGDPAARADAIAKDAVARLVARP